MIHGCNQFREISSTRYEIKKKVHLTFLCIQTRQTIYNINSNRVWDNLFSSIVRAKKKHQLLPCYSMTHLADP